MSDYKYSADDESLLTPFLYKCFVYPFLKIVPLSVPANLITLTANSFVLLAFLLAYFNNINGTNNFLWLIPIFVFCYLVGDCSDGIQARRTKTGSPLGEFFDHFLDSFVTGLMVGIFMLCFRVKNPLFIFLAYQLLYIGQIGTFWERLHLGVMKFFKISTSEGLISMSLISASYGLAFVQNYNNTKIVLNFSVFEIAVLMGLIIAGVTGVLTILKTKKYSVKLFLHLALSIAIGAVLAWFVETSLLFYTLIVSFYNIVFIASVLAATNDKSAVSYPDFVVPISFVLFFVLPDKIFLIQLVQIIYLAIIILIKFAKFLNQHKQYWYWKNPKLEETS